MQSLTAIANWCLLVFGIIALIGWAGGGIAYHEAYHRDECPWCDLFNWTLYIAFTVFILAVAVRFILFCITGE